MGNETPSNSKHNKNSLTASKILRDENVYENILSEQTHYIFSYITNLSYYTHKFKASIEQTPPTISNLIKTSSSSPPHPEILITTKEIYEQNGTIKDIILLDKDIYITYSDFKVELWNFQKDKTPKPINLKIPTITSKISPSNYYYCLTKLSHDLFGFALKSDKTIIICHIEDGTKPYCFILENKYDIVNMVYLSNWKICTCSREGIISIWDVKIQECKRQMKDKKVQLTVNLMEGICEQCILVSDWKTNLSFILDISTSARKKSYDKCVKKVMRIGNEQCVLIFNDCILTINTNTFETVKKVATSISGQIKFIRTFDVNHYIYFNQVESTLYLTNRSSDTKVKSFKCSASLTNVLVIRFPNKEFTNSHVKR